MSTDITHNILVADSQFMRVFFFLSVTFRWLYYYCNCVYFITFSYNSQVQPMFDAGAAVEVWGIVCAQRRRHRLAMALKFWQTNVKLNMAARKFEVAIVNMWNKRMREWECVWRKKYWALATVCRPNKCFHIDELWWLWVREVWFELLSFFMNSHNCSQFSNDEFITYILCFSASNRIGSIRMRMRAFNRSNEIEKQIDRFLFVIRRFYSFYRNTNESISLFVLRLGIVVCFVVFFLLLFN